MKGPNRLIKSEGRWRTRMGKCFPGERVIFRGKDLHEELGNNTWLSLYVFAVTGRELPPDVVRLIELMWLQTNYPDPRIWNNRVASLAGTTRSTGALGISAALAVSEATIYGRRADLRAYGFLTNARKRFEIGESVASIVSSEIRTRRGLPGFGRPIVSNDERIEHMMHILEEYQQDRFPTVRLAFNIEQVSKESRYRLRLNYAGLTAAICADIGLSAREYYLMAYPVFLAGMIPCYLDSEEQPAGTFFPIACNHLEYSGPPIRKWL